METKDRTKEAQKIIRDKLSNYFSDEQLSYIDDLGISILSEYFSNKDLEGLRDATPEVLKAFVDRNQKDEVKRRLTHIAEHEVESLIDWYIQECDEVEEVYDPQSDTVIALEVKHKTLKNSPKVHWDGRFIVAIGDRLAATRTRLDGVVGYQSAVKPLNPDFVPAMSKYFDERDKLLAAYLKKVEAAKAKHEKKVAAAIKEHNKAIDKYNEDIAKFDMKYHAGVGPEDKTAKEEADMEKHRPVQPVYVQPEYVEVEDFEEPEKPDVEQYLLPTDSRWSEIESQSIPEERVMSSITNSDIIEVKRQIESTGYKKPVRKVSEGYKVDQFILRKVK